MTTIKFRDWEINVDRQATEEIYNGVEGGIADGCECNQCKNFLDNRENIFPAEVKTLFQELGIDYRKECENMCYGKQKDGMHHYNFWYHFKGKIITQNENENGIKPNENLLIGFGPMRQPTFFKDIEDLIQIEFYSMLSWTIAKELEIE